MKDLTNLIMMEEELFHRRYTLPDLEKIGVEEYGQETFNRIKGCFVKLSEFIIYPLGAAEELYLTLEKTRLSKMESKQGLMDVQTLDSEAKKVIGETLIRLLDDYLVRLKDDKYGLKKNWLNKSNRILTGDFEWIVSESLVLSGYADRKPGYILPTVGGKSGKIPISGFLL
jgi:hypothetical protein